MRRLPFALFPGSVLFLSTDEAEGSNTAVAISMQCTSQPCFNDAEKGISACRISRAICRLSVFAPLRE